MKEPTRERYFKLEYTLMLSFGIFMIASSSRVDLVFWQSALRFIIGLFIIHITMNPRRRIR